jgi:DNA replication protein DnaC
MNLIELNRSLVQLRLSGMAAVMETRLLQAQSENMVPIDLISTLVSDELACRSKRLLERRHKQAQFRDAERRLDNFDFQFNPKMNRSLVFDLATAGWVGRREDALFLGPPGSGKSHCAQAIGHAVIQQGYRVLYREAHALLEELADATLDGKRKEHMELLTTVASPLQRMRCSAAQTRARFIASAKTLSTARMSRAYSSAVSGSVGSSTTFILGS